MRQKVGSRRRQTGMRGEAGTGVDIDISGLGFDFDGAGSFGGSFAHVVVGGALGFLPQEPAAVVDPLAKQEIHLAAESKCYISI